MKCKRRDHWYHRRDRDQWRSVCEALYRATALQQGPQRTREAEAVYGILHNAEMRKAR
jgi:hypothetical protein